MQKLTPRRIVSNLHAIHGANGEQLGVVDPSDFDLDPDEMEMLLRKQASKAQATGAVARFMQMIRSHMKASGKGFNESLSEVSRANPQLAQQYLEAQRKQSEL